MSENHPSVPKWLLLLTWFFAALELMVSLSMLFSPQSFMDGIDHSAKGLHQLISMWAVRQFALACILGFAAFKKSVPMLILAYLFFLVMFVGDLVIGITQQESPLVIAALLMCVLSSVLLFVLNKKN